MISFVEHLDLVARAARPWSATGEAWLGIH